MIDPDIYDRLEIVYYYNPKRQRMIFDGWDYKERLLYRANLDDHEILTIMPDKQRLKHILCWRFQL